MKRTVVYAFLLGSACCLPLLSATEEIKVDDRSQVDNGLGSVCCLPLLNAKETIKVDDMFQVDNGLGGVCSNVINRLLSFLTERGAQAVFGMSQENIVYRRKSAFMLCVYDIKRLHRLIDAVENVEKADVFQLHRSRFWCEETNNPLYLQCVSNVKKNSDKYLVLFSRIFECVKFISTLKFCDAELVRIRDALRASTTYLASISKGTIEYNNQLLAYEASPSYHPRGFVCYWPINVSNRYWPKEPVPESDRAVTEKENASNQEKPVSESDRAVTEKEKEWLAKYVPLEHLPSRVAKSFKVPIEHRRAEVTEGEKKWLTNYMSLHYNPNNLPVSVPYGYPVDPYVWPFKTLVPDDMSAQQKGIGAQYAYKLLRNAVIDLKRWSSTKK